MKYVFSIIALCAASILSADQYYGDADNRHQPSYQKQSRNQEYSQNEYSNGNQADNSDQKIYKKIQSALSGGWFSKGYPAVTFDVYNGNVTLKGSVETMDDKNKVADSIRKIDGVHQISNRITITSNKSDSNRYSSYSDTQTKSKNDYSDSQLQDSEKKYPRDTAATNQDRQINAKIRDKLSGWFSSRNETIILRTANGIVIISGTVDKPEDSQKIQDKIRNIEGVKNVNNQLSAKNR